MNVPASRPCLVYCIKDYRHQAVKIGVSRNPERRLRQLQTASPEALTLLGTLAGSSAVEAAFHRAISDRRMAGEWFDDRDGFVSGVFMQMAWEAGAA